MTWSKSRKLGQEPRPPDACLVPHFAPTGQGPLCHQQPRLSAARNGPSPLTMCHTGLTSCLPLSPKPAQLASLGYKRLGSKRRGEEKQVQNNASRQQRPWVGATPQRPRVTEPWQPACLPAPQSASKEESLPAAPKHTAWSPAMFSPGSRVGPDQADARSAASRPEASWPRPLPPPTCSPG